MLDSFFLCFFSGILVLLLFFHLLFLLCVFQSLVGFCDFVVL